jgi:hypothetical protein
MLRLAGLLSLGALAVHQLRYLIGYGDQARAELSTPSHSYLVPLAPLLVGIVVVVLAELVSRAARGGAPAPRLRPLWAGSTLTLITVFCAQELLEGASPVTHGGWLAAPLAAIVGLAIAVIMRGATASVRAPERPWRAPAPLPWPPLAAFSLLVQIRNRAPRVTAARGPPVSVA